MSSVLKRFQLNESDLSFLTSEELSPEEFLWSQIELSANVSKFELCESLITIWFNKYVDQNQEKYKTYEKKVSDFLLNCFKQNYENQKIWFIYQIIKRLKLDHLVDTKTLEIDLILRNHFNVNEKQSKDVLIVSKLSSCHPIDDKVIIVLKNLIQIKPKIANLLIDLFNDKNSFNFIYSQSLIHALKNDNKNLVLDLLTIFPDREIDKNVALLEEVCDQFSGDEKNEFLLYKSVLLRQTPKLIQKISDIRQQKNRKTLYDCEKHCFNFKECFLLAVNHKKHFIAQLLEDERVGFDFPPKQRLFFLIYLFHKNNLKVDNFETIETNIAKLVFDCEEIQALSQSDSFVGSLVKRLKFIINFTKWCIERMDSNTNTNIIHSRFTIFRSLFLGESPLKILLKYGFLCNKSEVKENLIEDICELLSQSDESELMTYRGFLVIRHTIMWIILSDSDSFEEQIAFLFKRIFPISFRVEILENVFSLLFLTQNELIDNETDEDDYTEETTNVNKEFGQTMATQCSQTSNIHSGTPYFLCPNSLVPQLLSMLKEIIIDSQAALFTYNYKKSKEMPKIHLNSSIKDMSECKIRLERLMKYVSEAQWRYDVIEPAFNKNVLNQNKKKSEMIDPMDGIERESYDISDEKEFSRSLSSNSGSDNEKRASNEIFSSLISCMLASPKQLLRYSLLEGQIERAKQVVKLFEYPLKNSEEVRELEIICKWKELTANLKTLSTPQKAMNTSKIGEIAATGLRATQIQSLIHEFMLELQVSDRTKNTLVIDFALTTSPSIDVSEIILDSILQNQKVCENFPEKINLLLNKIRSMISDLSKEYDNKSISFAQLLTQFVEKEKFWDSNAFREQKRNEKQLKIAFEELNKHLIDSDLNNDFETTVSSPIDSIKNTKRTNILFEKLLRFCSDGKFQYLKVLFYYVRKVTRALNECRKNSHSSSLGFSDSSYFSILKQSPSAILCSMVLKDGISPKFVDDFAKEMKVDLIGTLCSVLCPKIPSHLQNDCSINEFVLTESCHPSLCEIIESHLRGVKYSNPDLESLMIQNHFEDETDSQNNSFIDEKVRNIDLIKYFNTRSPLLVELMKMLRLVKDDVHTDSDFKFKPNSPLHKWVETIRSKFGYSPGTDQTSVLSLAFWPRIVSSNSLVIKALEHYAIKGSLLEIYDLFQYIDVINTSNSSFISTDSSFKTLRNAILSRLALEQQEVKYALQIIDDPNIKCDVIIELIDVSNEFEMDFTAIRTLKSCLSSLSHEIQTQDLSSLKNKLILKINEIEFYSKIGQLTGLHSWKDAKHNLKGVDILTIIKTKRKYPMAVDWFKIQKWETETSDLQYELLVLSYCQLNDLSSLTQLLLSSDTIEVNVSSLIGKVLNLVSNFDIRLFLIEFLLKHFKNRLNDEIISHYNNYILGIKLIKGLNSKIQNNYINIITKPLLIIEQMLMNIEYEALEEAVKILNFDYLIETYAQKAVEIQIYDIPSAGASVISDATLISSTFLDIKSSPKTFSMPEFIPTKDQWIPDSNVNYCMLCKYEKFSMLNRRHHCRRCGRVVCANCSQNTLLIREIKINSSVRVCDECYVQTQRNNRKESIGSESSSLNPPTIWVLSCDDLQNDSLRMEFYYDSSPSVSLCLTLLKLHSDKNRCCKLIVDSICKPLLETVVSSQVDYGLVIGMIRSLLVSTRISMEEQKSELMDQLNHLLDRLDVIRMLINSNCNTKELISYALSTNENSILKLQERLIEMERFELSRDLAAKFGLDSKSIFKTWAFICLKHNQLSEARDKFKLVFDKNKSIDGNRDLENIINVLSKRKYWSDTSLSEDCLQIKRGKLALNETNSSKFYVDSNELQTKNPKIFNEVMYYLKEYGTNEEIIKFYVKNSMFKPAITLILNNSNLFSNNFFMKELFITSIKRGFLSTFLRDLKSCDPSLSRIWKYLLAACKYLSSNHMYNVLHILQVFMGDHLRAAITQINCFFLTPTASDYTELYSRIDNLQAAKQHCTDFLSLNPINYRSGCLIMEREEVMKQLRALNLQIDITIRFHEKRIKGFLPNGVYSPDNSGRELKNPSTILDHNKARKTELAALVTISYGQQIAEGFTVCQMIIKDHNLDSAQVYRLSGRALVQMPQIKVMDSFTQLLQCIRSSYTDDISLCDDIIGASIRSSSDPSLIESLIKLLSNDINKFDAYILSGKLKSAYLLAINSNRETDVLRVLEASKRANDTQIAKICQLWIHKKSKQKV